MVQLSNPRFDFSGFPWVSRRPWPFNHELSSRIVAPVVKVFGSSSWKRTGTETCKDFIRRLEWLLGTLPNTNGLPRKNRPGPRRKRSYFKHPFSGAKMLSFREDRSWDVYAMQIQEIAVEIHMFFFFCSRRGFGLEGVSSWHFTFRWRKIEVNKGYFEEVPGETSEDYRWWVPYHSTDSKKELVVDADFSGHRSGIDTVKGWTFFNLGSMIRLRIVTWKTLRGRLPSAMRWLTYASFLFRTPVLTLRQENYCKEYGERSCEDTEKLILMEANDNHEEEHTVPRGNGAFFGGKIEGVITFFWTIPLEGLLFVVVSTLFFKTVWQRLMVVLLLCWTFDLEFVLGTSKKEHPVNQSGEIIATSHNLTPKCSWGFGKSPYSGVKYYCNLARYCWWKESCTTWDV